jgi:DNA-binding HxlR family transcriptional regulator
MAGQSPPPPRSQCPIACALDVLGDRWTLVVLRDLIFLHKRRYQELLDSNEGIATNILASRLKQLEAAGLVTRQADPAAPRRALYAPTSKALDLLPVLLELMRWSVRHNANTYVPPQLMRKVKRDSAGFIAELRLAHGLAAKPARAHG